MRCGSEDGLLVAAEDGADLAVLGEAAGTQLGEDELVVLLHFEAASIAGDQDEFGDVALVRLEQFLRQTDGTRLVISDRAVADLDLHARPPKKWLAVYPCQIPRAPSRREGVPNSRKNRTG